MRKLKRSIAHHLMETEGVTQINKPKFIVQTHKDGTTEKTSYFARHWREYWKPAGKKTARKTRRFRWPFGREA